MRKLLLLDLDGTLLRKPNFDISPSDLLAINNIIKAGYDVGIATGRSPSEVAYLEHKHSILFNVVIALNGMYFKENDNVDIKYFDENVQELLCDYLDSDKIEYEAQTINKRYFSSQDYYDWLDFSMGAELFITPVKDQLNKIVIRQFNNEPLDKITQVLNEKFHDDLNVINASENIIEIVNIDVDKVMCLENLNYESISAVGDSYNDLEILKSVASGFLMLTADDKLKDILKDKVTLVGSVADAINNLMEEK